MDGVQPAEGTHTIGHDGMDSANELQTKLDNTGQHRTTPDGPDNTKPWTGQHRTTPDGLDDTNSTVLDVMKKEPPTANLGDGHIHEVAEPQGG